MNQLHFVSRKLRPQHSSSLCLNHKIIFLIPKSNGTALLEKREGSSLFLTIFENFDFQGNRFFYPYKAKPSFTHLYAQNNFKRSFDVKPTLNGAKRECVEI